MLIVARFKLVLMFDSIFLSLATWPVFVGIEDGLKVGLGFIDD